MPDPVLVTPEITSDPQLLAALSSTGAGFESAGGAPLMLTEAVENGVDSIIQARQVGLATKGTIRVIIDRAAETVEVHDDGMGFQDPVHIARKPFDSLKAQVPDVTGRFARGIQGFRAFCGKLTFLTRRSRVPAGESLVPGEFSGRAVRLGFESTRPQVELQVIDDGDFTTRCGFDTGAVAVYSSWKPGQFARLKSADLIQRLQHHFGELVREGNFSIEVTEGASCVLVEPTDFTEFDRININPVPVFDASGATRLGEVVPELFLMEKRKRDRFRLPYLLYKNRPVGDRPISQLEEFQGSTCWDSSYITGFIRCDFCEINELRLALKAGYTRDALYREMEKLQEELDGVLREHGKAIFEARRQAKISDLVLELQDFLRKKRVFSFKVAHAAGSLAQSGAGEPMAVSPLPGGSIEIASQIPEGEAGVLLIPPLTQSGPPSGSTAPTGTDGGEVPSSEAQSDGAAGGTGGGGSEHASGSADGPTAGEPPVGPAPSESEAQFGPGDEGAKGKRRGRRRRPRGFNLDSQDDEFNDELSWFDPPTSTVVINSGHPRYHAREGEELAQEKALMDYLAELYIWEITKLAGAQNQKSPEEIQELFFRTKFEFFEERKTQ